MRFLLCALLLSLLAGCVVYEPVPVQGPSRFDRAWDAATGAMYDQGVQVSVQDRGTGVIKGGRGSASVDASVRTLADGRVEVRFNSSDSGLAHRISESYDRRMGR
jgi:CubicO group peptidase (beta-lactamase class C family)